MDDITQNQNVDIQKIFALRSEIAEELRNESGDFHFALILRPSGKVDVYVDPGMTVVHGNDDGTFDIFKIPEDPQGGSDYEQIAAGVPATHPTVKKMTKGKTLKETTPIAWTAFDNSGCVNRGGIPIYC